MSSRYILNIYSISDTIQNALQELTKSSQQLCEVGTIIPNLQMGKLRVTKQFSSDHKASREKR